VTRTVITELRNLNQDQRAACIASLLGWSLDAFDFFLMVFVVRSIAGDFHAQIKDVAFAITVTLMFRPVGALFFGWLAERFGRRPVLLIDVLLYSFLELASAFAPSLGALLVLRALFGFAMGGEWGVGSSLVMETIPAQSRGIISGILQEGYALGYLLAAIVYGLFFSLIGWRGMFVVGVLPALLVLYIRVKVKESPVWSRRNRRGEPSTLGGLVPIARHWKRFLYVILLMTGFNFFSHGTQDLYPTFLEAQHHLAPGVVSAISIVANLGAILGGVVFGIYSQRAGRRRAIVTAALLALPVIPLWAFAATPVFLGLGAFLIQLMVQGAWGVVPVHLNELSPEGLRGIFPGFAYQLGNLLACGNAVWQAGIAADHHGNYGLALAWVAGLTALALAIITACGPEAKDIVFGDTARDSS
jgi:MFS transporter, SHS family, lactate transporter